MKVRSLLPVVATAALAVVALSIPSPILSTKAIAQNTSGSPATPPTKKAGGTANNNAPKGKLYKSPGDRARCRMGNC